MDIIYVDLLDWGADHDLRLWFGRTFAAGGTTYQGALDALAAANRIDDARWLIARAGTSDPRACRVRDHVSQQHNLFVAGDLRARSVIINGTLLVTGDCEVTECIHTGGAIYVGGHLSCDGMVTSRHADIRVGGDIMCAVGAWALDARGEKMCQVSSGRYGNGP